MLLWLLLGVAAAASAAGDANDADATLDGLRRQIDQVQSSLGDNTSDAEMLRLRASALAAQAQATEMAERLAPQLASVEARLAELGTLAPGSKEAPDIAGQRAQLVKARSALDAQVKLARLLGVEGAQLAAQVGAARRSQFQARLGERTDSILAAPFWSELREDLPQDAARLSALGADLAAAARRTPASVWLLSPLLVLAAWAVLWWARRAVVGWITTRVPPGRLRRSLHAVTLVLQRTLLLGVPASVLASALDWTHSLPEATRALLGAATGMGWFGGYLAGLATALISATRPSWRLSGLSDAVAERLRWFPHQLAAVVVAAWCAERLAAFLNASLAMTVAVNCIVALALAFTVGGAMMRAEHTWRRTVGRAGSSARPVWRVAAAGFSWLVLAGAVVCLLAGYVAFGSFAVKQVVWAGIVIASTYLLLSLIDDALMAWVGVAQHDEAAKTDMKADATASKALAQVAVLASFGLRLMIGLVALMLLLAPFGEGPADLLRRSGQWQQGVAIGEIRLLPAAVLRALAVLVASLVAVRALRHWLAERYLPTTALDPGMRSSATSLFGYAGVVVAVALAMSALGIGLERVAWVASALSVGIGFGLQAVVQNFVSGLILLAERPVKVGDWVSLGGVEGDIRRINVRATEIQMGDRSTVIVPNSEFITKVVRNVTLADPLGLVQLKLPVPLGADAEQVRELLLAAFAAEPEVLDTPAPKVLLDGVEAGKLLFNATGYVSSPRLAASVRSALLFEVLARLSAAKITLDAPPTLLMQSVAAADTPAAPTPLPTPLPPG